MTDSALSLPTLTTDANLPVESGFVSSFPTWGDDVLKGSFGSDRIDGMGGNDSISGEWGDDTLIGGQGNDTLDGGEGNDILVDDFGFVKMKGGFGNDAFQLGGNVYGGDIDGGSGKDILDFQDAPFSSGLTIDLNFGSVYGGGMGYMSVWDVESAIGSTGNDKIYLGWSGGWAVGAGGHDQLKGSFGSDSLIGGDGSDVLDGDAGIDYGYWTNNFSNYTYKVANGWLSIEDKRNSGAPSNILDGLDMVKNLERLVFADRTVEVINSLHYIASYEDLIQSLGANVDAGLHHYLNTGYLAGRRTTFDISTYAAKYADVRILADKDPDGAARHYIETGYREGRNLNMDGNDSLLGSAQAETLRSDIGNDSLEGRGGDDFLNGGAGVDVAIYANPFSAYEIRAIGAGKLTVKDNTAGNTSTGKDTLEAVESLRFGDREVAIVDGLRYIASHADLIETLGNQPEAGLDHYFATGVAAGRTADFDAALYLAKYAEVRSLHGNDLQAATKYYVETGYKAGHRLSLDGNDSLMGTDGHDVFNAGAGNDEITGGRGNDTVDGGSGQDTLVFANNFASYAWTGATGVLTATDNTVDVASNTGVDAFTNIETLRFADRDIQMVDGLRYIASYGDLVNALGANEVVGQAHYLKNGIKEGRSATFNADMYLAKYADLRTMFGTDTKAALKHYIEQGFKAGRSLDNSGDNYLVGNANSEVLNGGAGNDEILARQGNDTIDGGSGNDVAVFGNIFSSYKFQYAGGAITVIDNAPAAFSTGIDTVRNVENLWFHDRKVKMVDGLQYLASYGDLINAYGTNIDAGLNHYLNSGVKEGRTALFDAGAYLAKNHDLRAVFDTNVNAATNHYIQYGFKEGRTWSLAGHDSLLGSAGPDKLDGGTGDDRLTGAGGADIFKFSAVSGKDLILDFNRAEGDKIALSANLNGNGIVDAAGALTKLRTTSDGLLILDLGAGNHVGLTGVASLQASDFIFI